MVTTPKFHVTQDATWVFVHVHVPYVRVSEMEFLVDGMELSFYCKPYLLKLHFPYEVVDNELTKAVYDPNKDNGTIVVHLSKKEPGQVFPDLDMLTKLLQPQRPIVDFSVSKQMPLIEVIKPMGSEPIDNSPENLDRVHALNDRRTQHSSIDEDSSTIRSTEQMQTDSSLLGVETSAQNVGLVKLDAENGASDSIGVHVTDLKPSYGFNNAYSDFFRVWHGEVSEIVSLPDPDHIQPKQRRILREATEEQQFDIERYLTDFANQGDDMYFELAMAYVPFWRSYPVLLPPGKTTIESRVTESSTVQMDSNVENVGDSISDLSLDASSPSVHSASQIIFTDTEQELLLRLPRKEFLLSECSVEEKLVVGGLVDILIGFAYEQLTTQGDSGVESTWTVSIVSPTLSWLDSNADLGAVVRSSIRRMITFPFLRQYDLALRSVCEASEMLKRGKRVVLRALLMLYRIFEKSETQYLLNSLFIQDYCVWIQSVDDDRLRCVSNELDVHIAAFIKSNTGWALEELERSLIEADDNQDVKSSLSSESGSDSSESGSDSSELKSSIEEDSTCHDVDDDSEGETIHTK